MLLGIVIPKICALVPKMTKRRKSNVSKAAQNYNNLEMEWSYFIVERVWPSQNG